MNIVSHLFPILDFGCHISDNEVDMCWWLMCLSIFHKLDNANKETTLWITNHPCIIWHRHNRLRNNVRLAYVFRDSVIRHRNNCSRNNVRLPYVFRDCLLWCDVMAYGEGMMISYTGFPRMIHIRDWTKASEMNRIITRGYLYLLIVRMCWWRMKWMIRQVAYRS